MAKAGEISEGVSDYVEPRFDGGPGWRAKIGLIALVHDLGFEPEFMRFSQCDGVAVYANRIDMDFDTTPETLRDSEAYRVLSPERALELAEELGAHSVLYLNPLLAGIDPRRSWDMLRLYEREVHPYLPR